MPRPRLLRCVGARWRGCGLSALALCLVGEPVHAADMVVQPLATAQFDADFLHGTGGMPVDVSRFERGNPVLPGEYLVDLAVNGQFVERLPVTFHGVSGHAEAQPCIDRTLLARTGLNLSALSKEQRRRLTALPTGACLALADLSPDIAAVFDQSRLQLSLLIPQVLIARQARNYVSPELWDRGVPSATLRYDANFYHADSAPGTTDSGYLRLDSGINLGTWHLRQSSALAMGEGAWRVTSIATYLVHDIPALKSRLALGDAFTDGAVFDSFGFRGVVLATDDRMRPDSQSGYAPTVHGIARTNARVRVTQNGVLLLETTVSPGPFQIDDLYPTGYGGDLDVTVLEADGSQQSFKVPYAALPQMLRPQVLRYSLAGGVFRDGGIDTHEGFFQGVLQYGLSNRLTGYVGGQFANGYSAGLVGAALNTPLGAIAVDATLALADLPQGASRRGYSLRASLAKTIPASRTTLSFSAYRYSSDGFYSLQDVLRLRSGGLASARQRERLQVNVSQDLPKRFGSLYLSAAASRYWDRTGSDLQFQAGYNNVARMFGANLNYGLSYVRQKDTRTGSSDNRLLLSLSVALGSKPNSPQMFANVARIETAGQVDVTGQVGINGTLGEIPRLSYNVVATTMADFDSLSLGLAYRGKGVTLTGNGSVGTGFRQLSLGMSGGVVAHPGGVTLANQLEDTIAVVSAPGAAGARVRSGTDVVIDGRGNAVVPFVRPYRMNEIQLDPEGLSADVELKSTSRQVAPRADAVVMVRFETVTGQAVLFHVALADGTPVPFGASVLDAAGGEIAIAGQDGQVFLRSSELTGIVTVKWSDAANGACRFRYQLPFRPERKVPVIEMTQTCGMAVPEKAS